MAKEGWKYIIPMSAVVILSAVVLGHHVLTYIAALLLVVFLQFFRPPGAPLEAPDNVVLSPAGGFVIEIVEEHEPLFLKSTAQRISIFMTPVDVHVNTAPITGGVGFTEYRTGTFFKADKPEARLQNERMLVGFERTDGIRCLAAQVAGWLARRIVCDVKMNDKVQRGRRYGMIEFGSRMDLHVPASARILVKPGQHVRTAKTVLAEI